MFQVILRRWTSTLVILIHHFTAPIIGFDAAQGFNIAIEQFFSCPQRFGILDN